MKKTAITGSTILIIVLFAVSVFAWGCGGMHGNGNYNGMHGNNYTDYNNSTNQSFYNDTQALRASIAADRTELNALMKGTTPDSQRARALSMQISKSENELRNKAQEYHVSGRIGMMGYGRGWSCGIAGHNHDFAGCW